MANETIFPGGTAQRSVSPSGVLAHLQNAGRMHWPPARRTRFAPARTVIPGRPVLRLSVED